MSDITLTISSPGGLPLAMAGYLLEAVGTAYPHTELLSDGSNRGLSLRIPHEDYLDGPQATTDDLSGFLPEKDDPAMVAFTNGLRDGGLLVGPPPWLTALLRTTAENLVHDVVGEANYMSMELIPQNGGDPFVWIICRPGAPSPHELRRQAEDRVALLEQQLHDAGIAPAS